MNECNMLQIYTSNENRKRDIKIENLFIYKNTFLHCMLMHKKGKFIVFEGIDGSGKSSQVFHLKSYLESEGHKVYTTFEPTDNEIGKMIRAILKGDTNANQLTIAALFAADRLHHILNEKDGILKKLDEGYIVLSDRYYFSSYAYHSMYVDMDWVIEINKKSAELLKPDLNIFIDLAAEAAMQRIEQNRIGTEMYETREMLQKVYDNYQTAFEKMKNQEKIVRINSEVLFEDTAKNILIAVEKLLKQ